MANCKILNICPFFNNKMGMEALAADFYKKKFCQGDYSSCARYTLYTTLSNNEVPLDLYPNELERAINIITKHAKG